MQKQKADAPAKGHRKTVKLGAKSVPKPKNEMERIHKALSLKLLLKQRERELREFKKVETRKTRDGL